MRLGLQRRSHVRQPRALHNMPEPAGCLGPHSPSREELES